MSNRTITSSYQMRKRRYQDSFKIGSTKSATAPTGTTISPLAKDGVLSNSGTCSPLNKLSLNKAKVKSGVCLKTPTRRLTCSNGPGNHASIRETTAVIYSGSQESQTEITWNCQSPEFEKVAKPTARNSEAVSDNVMNLLQQVFPSTKVEQQTAENTFLNLWMAQRDENDIVPATFDTRSTIHARIRSQSKGQVAVELKQLTEHVENATVVTENNALVQPTKDLEERQMSAASNRCDAKPGTSRFKEPLVSEKAADDSSEDVWDDEDIFNEEEFISQTQQLFTENAKPQNSNFNIALTSNHLQEAKGDFKPLKEVAGSDVPGSSSVNRSTTVSLIDESSSSSAVTAIYSPVAAVVQPTPADVNTESVKPKNMTVSPTSSSRNHSDGHDECAKAAASSDSDPWDDDDGIEEIMCSLNYGERTEYSLDALMNCSTQPYPANNDTSNSLNGSHSPLPTATAAHESPAAGESVSDRPFATFSFQRQSPPLGLQPRITKMVNQNCTPCTVTLNAFGTSLSNGGCSNGPLPSRGKMEEPKRPLTRSAGQGFPVNIGYTQTTNATLPKLGPCAATATRSQAAFSGSVASSQVRASQQMKLSHVWGTTRAGVGNASANVAGHLQNQSCSNSQNGASSQRYTPEEIEEKRRAALEKRRRRLHQQPRQNIPVKVPKGRY